MDVALLFDAVKFAFMGCIAFGFCFPDYIHIVYSIVGVFWILVFCDIGKLRRGGHAQSLDMALEFFFFASLASIMGVHLGSEVKRMMISQ